MLLQIITNKLILWTCNKYSAFNLMQDVATKIAVYLSSDADDQTRQRFFAAVEKIDDALAAWVESKPGGVGTLEKWDVQSSVVWISVNEAEHINIQICKSIAQVILEGNRVGDKYKIVVDPESDV